MDCGLGTKQNTTKQGDCTGLDMDFKNKALGPLTSCQNTVMYTELST